REELTEGGPVRSAKCAGPFHPAGASEQRSGRACRRFLMGGQGAYIQPRTSAWKTWRPSSPWPRGSDGILRVAPSRRRAKRGNRSFCSWVALRVVAAPTAFEYGIFPVCTSALGAATAAGE